MRCILTGTTHKAVFTFYTGGLNIGRFSGFSVKKPKRKAINNSRMSETRFAFLPLYSPLLIRLLYFETNTVTALILGIIVNLILSKAKDEEIEE